jgi:hypothetical protein
MVIETTLTLFTAEMCCALALAWGTMGDASKSSAMIPITVRTSQIVVFSFIPIAGAPVT